MSRLSHWKKALQRFGEPEKRHAERWPATGLSAFYGIDSAVKPAKVKDVSVSGVYLLTDERFATDQSVALILRLDQEPAENSDLRISIQTKAVWQGEDGVGLEFVLPAGMNPELCGALLHEVVSHSDRDEAAEVFRNLRTVLFLFRLCGAQAEEPILLLDGQLDPGRTATLFKIAFGAESLLDAKPEGSKMRVHPRLVTSILREGSWASDEMTLKLWTGLLASSCTLDTPDDSNQIVVDLLVHVTHTEAMILLHACEKALSSNKESAESGPVSVVVSVHEMIQITGVQDTGRNATDLAYLFNLGLMEHLFDFTSYREIETFDITPSRLGLELYRHCHGQSEKIDPQLVAAAREHLAAFFPPPIPSAFENVVALPDPPQK